MESGYLFDNATGIATLTFGGTSYILPRPDFGQLREFMTLNEKRVEAELGLLTRWSDEDDETADEKAEQKLTPETDRERAVRASANLLDTMRRENVRQTSLLSIRFDFWRQVSKMFGVTLPLDDDRIEPWIGNADLIDLLLRFWITFPFRRPGEPEAES